MILGRVDKYGILCFGGALRRRLRSLLGLLGLAVAKHRDKIAALRRILANYRA
jgi:hypothetical protein